MNWIIAMGVLLLGWSTMPFPTSKGQLQAQRWIMFPTLVIASLLLGGSL